MNRCSGKTKVALRKQPLRTRCRKNSLYCGRQNKLFLSDFHTCHDKQVGRGITHHEARKWYKAVFEIIVFLIAPFLWKGTPISRNRKMYDNVLLLGVGLFMMIGGLVIWGLGICGVIFTIKHVVVAGIMLNSLALLLLSVLVISFGSLIIIAALEFSAETNMRKVYEYSACAIALMSCIVSVIALIVTVLLNLK